MARNFSGTASTTPATLTITGGPAHKFYAKNTGSVALLINIETVHGDDDFDTLAAGDSQVYESVSPIKSAIVKTGSSTTTYTAGVVGGSA